MSVANKQITHLRALDANKKVITGTYTVRTGRVTDNFVIDNPIELDPASTFTLTVPSGYKMGQTLLLTFQGGDTTAVTVDVLLHETTDPEKYTMDADDEYLLLIWTGTEWAEVGKSCTTA